MQRPFKLTSSELEGNRAACLPSVAPSHTCHEGRFCLSISEIMVDFNSAPFALKSNTLVSTEEVPVSLKQGTALLRALAGTLTLAQTSVGAHKGGNFAVF